MRTVATSRPSRPSRHTLKHTLLVIAVLILTPLLGSFGTLTLLAVNDRVSLPRLASSLLPTGSRAHPATPSTHPPTLPNPKGFKVVTDKAVNMSVRYPTNWSVTTQSLADGSHFIGITSPGGTTISFYLSHLPPNETATYVNANGLDQANIQGLTQIGNIRQVQFVKTPNYRPTIGGLTWSEQDATFITTQNGTATTVHYTSIAVQHQKTYYIIYFYLPSDLYAQAMQKYFTPMLASARFLT
jgi:hypothetical protein